MKRGQMKLSFGMIFSIILIVVFVAFAFYAVKNFLIITDEVKVNMFAKELQEDIDVMWRETVLGSQSHKYNLPTKIEFVCFANYEKNVKVTDEELHTELGWNFFGDENLFFSEREFDSKIIKHIDLAKITEIENPICFENVGGKVEIRISLGTGDKLVSVGK